MDLPYYRLLEANLNDAGWNVKLSSRFPKRGLLRIRTGDVYHLHMLDQIFKTANGQLALLKLAYLILVVAPYMKLRGARLVWTCHELRAHENDPRNVTLTAAQIISALADTIIVHSVKVRDDLTRRFPNVSAKTSFVPHGTLYPYFQPLISSDTQCGSHEEIRFCSLGYMRWNKGNDTILRAFRSVTAPHARLVMAGNCPDAEYRALLEELAKADPRIQLCFKHLTDADIVDLHLNSDAAVFGFRECQTSGSVITSMSLGRAIVGPAVGHLSELVDMECGWTYDANKGADGLATSLNSAAASKSECADKGESAFHRIQQDDWDDITKRLIALYEGSYKPSFARDLVPH